MNFEPANAYKIRKAGPSDAKLLVELGKRSFYEAFAEQTAPQDMEIHLRSTFSFNKTAAQLKDDKSLFFICEQDSTPTGYAYLYPTRIPNCMQDPDAIQLIRFYLLKEYYGCGVGNLLMQQCLDAAQAEGYRSVWLSSWELNDRANAFYKKWQFKIVGRQKFKVGIDIQNDFIFVRRI